MVVWSSWGSVPRARLGLHITRHDDEVAEVASPLGGSPVPLVQRIHEARSAAENFGEKLRALETGLREVSPEHATTASDDEEQRRLYQVSAVLGALGSGYVLEDEDEQRRLYEESALIGFLGGGYL